MKEQLDEQKKLNRDLNEKCDKAERESKVLEVDLKQAQQQIEKLEEVKRANSSKIDELQLQLDQANQKKTFASTDLKAATQQITTLKVEEKRLRSELSETKEKMDNLKEQLEKTKQ